MQLDLAPPNLPWMEENALFPEVERAWGPQTEAPGLLAAGAGLDVPRLVQAYQALHRAGFAHSVETWLEGELVAGLYFVNLGHAVFGESMFSTLSDGSKMALAALVHVCQKHGIQAIDCQQNTPHLASLGARMMSRVNFIEQVQSALNGHSPDWKNETLDWDAWMRSQKP